MWCRAPRGDIPGTVQADCTHVGMRETMGTESKWPGEYLQGDLQIDMSLEGEGDKVG